MSKNASSPSSNNPSIPFSEPPYLNNLPSPYYTPALRKWQRACNAFITEHLTRQAWEWDTSPTATLPASVFATFAHANMLVPALPAPLPVTELHAAGIHSILDTVKVEDFTPFHNLIYTDEMIRSGLAGPGASMTTGFAFGIPPIIKFGSEELKQRFLPELLRGEKRVCIAITEPDAGSDVAGIQTSAALSADKSHYVVNGTKKWITNGIWSDYATMAVRTGVPGSGAAGLSLLVVPLKGYAGVRMRRLHPQGQRSAGTTFITLEDVRVPASNLVGDEGKGMKYIMQNFNHERLTIAIGATRQARVALSSSFAYVMAREAFGQPLIDQPVVRHRLAKAGCLLESQWAWIEQFVYQVSQLPKERADAELGGLTAAAKAHAGIVLKECADCAVLLFGGGGYTGGEGKGQVAEALWREVNGNRIPGGSEDVMLDLMVRQLRKNYERKFEEVRRNGGGGGSKL